MAHKKRKQLIDFIFGSFFLFFVIKTLDPDSLEMLDPDPYHSFTWNTIPFHAVETCYASSLKGQQRDMVFTYFSRMGIQDSTFLVLVENLPREAQFYVYRRILHIRQSILCVFPLDVYML